MAIATTTLLIGGAALAGIALAGYGTYQQVQASKASAEAQKQQIAEQRKQEAIRQRAMEMDARRRSLEVLRQQQRTKAVSLATATAQNAGKGSGLQGAFGQVYGQAGTNFTGIQQQLGFGREMFASNSLMSNARMSYADAQSDYMTGGAISSLGGAIISNLGQIERIGGNFTGYANQPGWANPARYGSLY